MQINRLCSVIAMLSVMIMVLAIAGCGTKTVSVTDVTYKDMPLQIHNDANVTALNKASNADLNRAGRVCCESRRPSTARSNLGNCRYIGFTTTAGILQGQLAQAQSQSYATSVDDYDGGVRR